MRVAWFLRLSMIAELACEYAFIAWLLHAVGLPHGVAWPLVAAVFVGWRYAFFTIEFALAQRWGEPVPPRHRVDALAWPRVIAEEVRCSIYAFSWLQPFARIAAPYAFAPPSSAPATQPVVLLVHGLMCNAAVWRDFKPVLERAGFDLEWVNLQSMYGAIDGYVDPLHAAIESICARRGVHRIFVVAHSMGGLVAARYLAKHGDARIAHVVTIGTPHHGTRMADLGHSTNVHDMRMNSAFLQALREACARRANDDFTCLYSWQDNLVVPQRSAVLPGAQTIAYSRVGHLAMLFDARVQRDVVAVLNQHASRR